jgi:hypothetical protein
MKREKDEGVETNGKNNNNNKNKRGKEIES